MTGMEIAVRTDIDYNRAGRALRARGYLGMDSYLRVHQRARRLLARNMRALRDELDLSQERLAEMRGFARDVHLICWSGASETSALTVFSALTETKPSREEAVAALAELVVKMERAVAGADGGVIGTEVNYG